MKIIALHQDAKCEFCQKDKDDVCEIEMQNGRTSRLCWKDLQNLARINLKKEPVHASTGRNTTGS